MHQHEVHNFDGLIAIRQNVLLCTKYLLKVWGWCDIKLGTSSNGLGRSSLYCTCNFSVNLNTFKIKKEKKRSKIMINLIQRVRFPLGMEEEMKEGDVIRDTMAGLTVLTVLNGVWLHGCSFYYGNISVALSIFHTYNIMILKTYSLRSQG